MKWFCLKDASGSRRLALTATGRQLMHNLWHKSPTTPKTGNEILGSNLTAPYKVDLADADASLICSR